MASNDEVCHVEKLVDEMSYQIWKFQVTVIFKANDLYEMVSGTRLFETLTKEDEKALWLKRDAKAQKVIITSIDRKYMMHIMNCKNSKEMFDKLQTIFEKSTSDQICTLLQQFYSFSYEKGTDMNTHISKIQNLVHKLIALKQAIDDNMVISKILCTLPGQYGYFVTAWESAAASEKTLDKLTARLLTEETRNKSKETEGEIAFESTEKFCKKCKSKTHNTRFCKKGKEERKCFKCGQIGHIARSCLVNTPNTSRGNACSICKKTNHKEQDCFFRNKKKEGGNEGGNKIAFLSENTDLFTQGFVVDSGSSSHMANSKELFTVLENSQSSIQVAKKNERMVAEGKGSIQGSTCMLNNVLYIPDLRKNLLSVNAITENNGEVIFTKEKVVIMKDDTKVLEGRKGKNGLYVVNLNQEKESYLTENKENIEEWHRKLGHLGLNNMKKLIDLTTGIKLTKSDLNELKTCEVCLKAKQTRLPFNTVRQRAKRPLEILHTDICGPIEPSTWDEKRYVLTVLDDYTHYCRTYLLRSKFEATEYLKEFVKEAEAHHNIKVSKIRSDNGGEYANRNFKDWCKNRGIVLDFTIPHSPQLNGKAERLNRTLLEKARALMFDANLSKEFWGEAIYVTAYLLNRSPTEAVDKTPIEYWTGRKPDLSRLQVFGSTAHAKVLGYVRKFESRSKKYIFVGYAPNGYRLWDKEQRKIVVHRDVVFVEIEKILKEDIPKINVENKVENNEHENRNEETEIEEIIDEDYQEMAIENQRITDLGEGSREELTKTTRSGRKIKIPERLLQDYVLDMEDEAFLTYQEAVTGPEKEQWTVAIKEEKESLNKNETWTYVDRNEVKDRRILTSKWIFRVKDDGRHKARLVIRGCQQKSGIDYNETFSPVVNTSSLRILFALAVKSDMKIIKFDIKTAFLYGNLSEDIFMHIPEGYESKNNENKICHLKKSLYGLKQAPLKWNERFTQFFRKNGLISLKSDRCMFRNDERNLYLAIYVDDGIVIGKCQKEVTSLITNLKREFEMTVWEDPNKFLGIEIKRQPGKVVLSQENYVQSVLEKFNMEKAKPVSTPMVSNDFDPENKNVNVSYPYREAVGSLLYLTNKTRPDISYPVNFCSRRMESPTDQDIINVKRIFRYLASAKGEGISFSKESDCEKLFAYCDSDYAGDIETRKSTTGYIVFFCGGPISWGSRKQPIVSLSSTESEYIAAADCVKELLFLKSIIDELTGSDIKIDLNVDNQSAITIIKNGQFNRRSKHIDVRYHFINEKAQEGIVNLKYCATERQIADILTKPLGKLKFQYLKGQFMCSASV